MNPKSQSGQSARGESHLADELCKVISKAHLPGLLIIRGKKSQISLDFWRQNRGKIGRFRGNFQGKLGRKAIGKKRRILWLSSGQISQEIDRFCADQTSVFNVFLTEDIICSFNNHTF